MARLSPRRQGDLGELSAMEWLGSNGYSVCVPIGHSPDYDLIADDGEALAARPGQDLDAATAAADGKSRCARAAATRAGTGP